MHKNSAYCSYSDRRFMIFHFITYMKYVSV
nr:MAG TPA: hypothetical protein [Caudoviricetes sp.]